MRKGLLLGLIALLALAGALWYGNRQRELAALELGIESTRVLSESFRATNQLKVAGLEGELVTRADDPGMVFILASSQTMKAPYSVDYFIDLGKTGPEDFSWDPGNRRLVIELPDVIVGKPNIDYGSARVSQSGLYISRDAGLRLQRKAAKALAAKAGKVANSPENLDRARKAAIAAVSRNAVAPLRAAGIEDVRVEVRFAFQGHTNDDVWDYTTPIDEIAARIARMKGEASPAPQ